MSTDSRKIPEYRSGEWSKYQVREPKDKPKGPHFAVVVFEKHYEDSGYSEREGGGSYQVPHVEYFAFTEKGDMERWLASAVQSSKDFFFFRVPKMGEVALQVSVGTEV